MGHLEQGNNLHAQTTAVIMQIQEILALPAVQTALRDLSTFSLKKEDAAHLHNFHGEKTSIEWCYDWTNEAQMKRFRAKSILPKPGEFHGGKDGTRTFASGYSVKTSEVEVLDAALASSQHRPELRMWSNPALAPTPLTQREESNYTIFNRALFDITELTRMHEEAKAPLAQLQKAIMQLQELYPQQAQHVQQAQKATACR